MSYAVWALLFVVTPVAVGIAFVMLMSFVRIQQISAIEKHMRIADPDAKQNDPKHVAELTDDDRVLLFELAMAGGEPFLIGSRALKDSARPNSDFDYMVIENDAVRDVLASRIVEGRIRHSETVYVIKHRLFNSVRHGDLNIVLVGRELHTDTKEAYKNAGSVTLDTKEKRIAWYDAGLDQIYQNRRANAIARAINALPPAQISMLPTTQAGVTVIGNRVR